MVNFVGKVKRCATGKLRFPVATAALLIVLGALMLGSLPSPAFAQHVLANRINGPIRTAQRQTIRGTVHPLVARSQDEGQLAGSTMIHGMSLVFRRSAAQEAELKNLLREQQTPGSPQYHQWLKPGQFAARFGMSDQDLAKAAEWLKSQGFQIDGIPASRDRVNFSGTAAQVDATFQANLHRYRHNGHARWANAMNIEVPDAIAPMTLRIAHLNTFRPRPQVARTPVHAPVRAMTSGVRTHYTLQDQSGREINLLAPADIATIYDVNGLYNNGITGKGQAIAVAGQTDIVQYQSDIAHFRSLSGLDATNLPQQVVVPNSGPATVYPLDLEEADIDVEWAGAVAQDATIVYVTVGSNQSYSAFDSMEYAIQTPLLANGGYVPIISISYGNCEQVFTTQEIQGVEQFLEQAAAQGQTVLAASGDSGSADCDNTGQGTPAQNGLAVDYPSSSQYVTGVGGSSFSGDIGNQSQYWNKDNAKDNGSALGYIPETVWNNTPSQTALSNFGGLSATGGGASTLFSKPSWQSGSTPNDGQRDVPDISLASDPSHDGYVLCTRETDGSGNFTQNPPVSTCVYPVGSHQVPYFSADGTGYLYGGTSIATPEMAGMIALWNQVAGNTNGVGNANPIFYQIAKNTPGAFHDVTTGSNAVVCKSGSPDCVSNGSGGYYMSCCSAASGYDKATGLGTIDASAMGDAWPIMAQVNESFSLVPASWNMTVNRGSSGAIALTLSPANGFSGTVDLACSNLPAGVSCAFANSSGQSATSVNLVSGTPASIQLTISASTSAAVSAPMNDLRSSLSGAGWPATAALAGVFGLPLFGILKWRRRIPRHWMTILVLAVGLMSAAALTACGGGSGGGSGSGGGGNGPNPPPPDTHTIMVTGTSGAKTVSTDIVLTVD